jgi:uncharacterized membrane protein YhaH (DUF805 family)
LTYDNITSGTSGGVTSTTAQPGWYLDPSDVARQRYWDGIAWAPVSHPRSLSPYPADTYQDTVPVKGMSFTQAVRSVLTQYAGFSGRARRSEYWWYSLFHAIVALVVMTCAISVALITSLPATDPPTEAEAAAMGIALLIAILVTDLLLLTLFLPGLALIIRRLHDTGRSGWYYLITLIPFGGIVLLVFMFEDSGRGPNQYGPSPKYV